MKRAVSSQQCTLKEFCEGFFIVLQEGQIVIINLISHITEEMPARFSLNIVVDVFRYSDPINLPYGTVCMDRRITYACGSIAQSKFIYTETDDAFFFYRV